ncbi:MAG: SEC-C metal-binding domain-containing protein [Acidimicrobiales bacterium]
MRSVVGPDGRIAGRVAGRSLSGAHGAGVPRATRRTHMVELIRRGHHADEVMAVLAAAGSDEPCPCGSGLKSERCHQH